MENMNQPSIQQVSIKSFQNEFPNLLVGAKHQSVQLWHLGSKEKAKVSFYQMYACF